MGGKGMVVVFDFDFTIIDCDSDDWVVEKMGLTDLFNELKSNPTLSWYSMMDRMIIELNSEGKTMEEIAGCLKQVPLHPQLMSAIKSAHAFGCDLRIISDANTFFIETILENHGLLECFNEINTNPWFIDQEGRFRLLPCHDFINSSHGCNLCPPNLCKGKLLERIRTSVSEEGKKRFIYVGDGKNDFCPSLRLHESDLLMPRRGFALWDIICNNTVPIKAKIYNWINGEELGNNLLNAIDSISVDAQDTSNPNKLIPTYDLDCKFQTGSLASHEAVGKALRVQN
ncbi:Phosphatase PHOSPHO-type [Dillenia turbinata]|uniref:Phosphatase PHOSPHO-type n=1 Tax=Dillenia turbinata TaxID=194707 RepID=A0AAN8UKE8_9MAGN